MKEFFKSMLSSDSEVSSKRFTSLFSLILLTGVIICSILGIVIQEEIFYVLTSIILGSGLMTLTKNK